MLRYDMTVSPLTRLLLLGVGLSAAGGCSLYNSAYVFDPGPVDVTAYKPGTHDDPVHTLITIVGVRRADKESGIPASLEVRLRVENTSRYPITFEPASLVLFSGDLERFPDPILYPAEPLALAPDQHGIVEAYFPFPDGRKATEVDLSGLNVRWTVSVDGHPVTSSASFQRRPDAYYDRHRHRIGVGYQRYPC